MNIFDDTVKEVKEIASTQTSYGLKGGLMGAVLFFMYYQRFTENEQYEDFTYTLLENILSGVSVNDSYDYANGITGIGRTLLFLKEEGFIDVDSDDFFNDLDKIVLRKLNSNIIVNFSHDTGVIGLCRYALHRPVKMDAVRNTLYHLTRGFEKAIYDISPVFLFPSEILQDIKLFLLEIGSVEEISEQTAALNQAIEYFEKNNSILQSNCPGYMAIQQLRKAEICSNKKEIESLLAAVSKESPEAVLRGLAYMNREKSSLPSWWKLF